MSDAEAVPDSEPRRGILPWLVVGLVAVAIVIGLWAYFRYEARHPSTSDAYVEANVVRVASRVSGQAVNVPIVSNQAVKAGDLLVKVDPAPYQAAVDEATAKVAMAQQQAGASGASVSAAQANVQARQAAFNNAAAQARRVDTLVTDGTMPRAEADKANAARDQAQAVLNAARADLERAVAELGESGDQNAQVRAALAELSRARLDLTHAETTAPVDGVLGPVALRAGTFVGAGRDLFPLVDTGTWFITANFKETALSRLKPGQQVHVTIDMYPGETWAGTVESLGPASGVSFALLPPENATGNWVKVAQRFPVRIRIEDDKPNAPLRMGASASVRVDTTGPGAPSTTQHATPGG